MTSQSPTSEPSPEEKALQALMLDDDLERLEDQLAEFNLFDVLSVWHREPQHSWVIAWLLDPRGSHGLGGYFLRAFLSQAAKEAGARGLDAPTPFDVDGWTLSDVEVARERHHIDILAVGEADGFVCLIENKIFSKEWAGQLRGYLKTVEREYAELKPFPIFLTPGGVDPMKETDRARYTPFDYETVADLLERTIATRGTAIGPSVRSFLEQYIRTLRRRVLDTPDNIDDLALRLYNNHREAIDLIIKAKSSTRVEGKEAVDAAVAACAPELKADFHSRGFWRFFSSALEDIPELKKSTWTRSGRMLLFEFKKPGDLGLYVYIGPGKAGEEPQRTRERLYNCLSPFAKTRGAPFQASKRIKGWWQVYLRPVLGPADYDPFNPESAKTKVAQAVREFYEQDYPLIVNAAREEFGLPPIDEEQDGGA